MRTSTRHTPAPPKIFHITDRAGTFDKKIPGYTGRLAMRAVRERHPELGLLKAVRV